MIPPDIDIISELFNSFICKILFVNIILTESIKYHIYLPSLKNSKRVLSFKKSGNQCSVQPSPLGPGATPPITFFKSSISSVFNSFFFIRFSYLIVIILFVCFTNAKVSQCCLELCYLYVIVRLTKIFKHSLLIIFYLRRTNSNEFSYE